MTCRIYPIDLYILFIYYVNLFSFINVVIILVCIQCKSPSIFQ